MSSTRRLPSRRLAVALGLVLTFETLHISIATAADPTTGKASPSRWAEFDKPPLTIFYPEDEAISNPPFFHWQAAPMAKSYRIKVVGAGVDVGWSTTRNFFTPVEPLKPGNYGVEIAALDADGNPIGEASSREFRIPDGRPGIPLSMNDIALRAGAPLAFSGDTVKAIEAATGPRAEIRDRLIEYARAEKPAALKDLKEPAPYPDGKYAYDDWNRINNVCFAVEEYAIRESAAFRLTGEKEFADRAKAVLLSVSEWDPLGSTGVWSSDHSAWSILHSLSLGYTLLRDQWIPDEKAKIARAIAARSRDMYEFLNPFVGKITAAGMMNDPDNNHPWFCAAALGFGGLALADENPEAAEWVAFTTQLFHGVFLPRGDSKGGWHEGINYWSYTLYFVFQYCDALKSATGLDLYRHPWLRNTAFFKIYVHPPAGGLVPFGDSKHNAPTAFDKLAMMRVASEYKNPLAWKYVDAIPEPVDDSRLVYALQWSDRSGIDANPANLPPLPFAFEFTDIGWVVSNSDVFNVDEQILFAFRSGKYFGRRFGHSHADQNSFILTAGGDKLLWDAGYYDAYLSPHHRQYSAQSIAHNVILVGGQGQVPFTRGTDGNITEFEYGDGRLRVQGDASKPIIYGGRIYQWKRTIEFGAAASPGDATNTKDGAPLGEEVARELIVEDDIWLAEVDTVSWLLHSAYPILFNPKDKSISITGERYALTGRFETDIPVDAILSTTFPERPGQQGRQYNDPKESPYKEQYHLELRTTQKLEIWKPRLRMQLKRVAD